VSTVARNCFLVVFATFPLTSFAHRLDEYLQATRLAVAADRIVLKMDLTPGVDVASAIFASIDTSRDGRISAAEGSAYAYQVLEEIALEVDGAVRPLDLVSDEFPSLQEMSAGIGVIRIEVRAPWAAHPGRHSLHFRNDHRPVSSAYLVNALVPTSPDIAITAQHRDTLQREIRLGLEID
jgi:hypothetical protein